MRSKLQCSESSFLALLKTAYFLDQQPSMHGKFKLVRIKDKLDTASNNVIINYLMGGIPCQLQMSIQQPEGKQKNYYTFSHFVYELTRGNFGAIAQLAIMTSQLDSMISANQNTYYEEKSFKRIEPPIDLETTSFNSRIKNSVYKCKECHALIINDVELFTKESHVCNECVLKNKNPQSHLKNQHVRILISENFQFLKRLRDYGQLKNANKKQLQWLISIAGDSTPLTLYMVIHVDEEMKTFKLALNEDILQRIEKTGFNYSDLQYVNIT